MSNIFDFGFTAVNEDELSSVTVEDLQSRLDNLYKAMIPLLSNLKKNPDKAYIHWPNRTAVIDKQIEKITAITRG